MREDGLRIDRLLLTTDDAFTPTGFGPAESERLTDPQTIPTTLTHTIVYTYDNLYRLTEADYSTGDNYGYGYDAVGNRLQQIINALVVRIGLTLREGQKFVRITRILTLPLHQPYAQIIPIKESRDG